MWRVLASHHQTKATNDTATRTKLHAHRTHLAHSALLLSAFLVKLPLWHIGFCQAASMRRGSPMRAHLQPQGQVKIVRHALVAGSSHGAVDPRLSFAIAIPVVGPYTLGDYNTELSCGREQGILVLLS